LYEKQTLEPNNPILVVVQKFESYKEAGPNSLFKRIPKNQKALPDPNALKSTI
jgi:hypothetical protein